MNENKLDIKKKNIKDIQERDNILIFSKFCCNIPIDETRLSDDRYFMVLYLD